MDYSFVVEYCTQIQTYGLHSHFFVISCMEQQVKHFIYFPTPMLPCPLCHKAQSINLCPFRPKARCKLLMLPIRKQKTLLVPCFPHKHLCQTWSQIS